jgi:hypothetical protein
MKKYYERNLFIRGKYSQIFFNFQIINIFYKIFYNHSEMERRQRQRQRSNSQLHVTNYNRIITIWTDEETEYLIDQRMSRNDEFWDLNRNERDEFWQSIAAKINEIFGTTFTSLQVKTKWKNLVRDHLVSKFYFD